MEVLIFEVLKCLATAIVSAIVKRLTDKALDALDGRGRKSGRHFRK